MAGFYGNEVKHLLELYFMGTPRVMISGEDVTAALSGKAIGVLAYLVLHRDKPVPRERMATLFWSESNRDSAKYNFRHTLWSINKLLKSNGVSSAFLCREDNETCIMVSDGNWSSDVVELEEGVQRGAGCLELYKGEFLRDLRVKESPDLDDWIIYHRERIQKIYFEEVSRLARRHAENQHFQSATECVDRLLSINPLQEELHLQLMKLHLMNGNRIKAIQQYEKCREILRRELNLSPMEEINHLYRQIVQEKTASDQRPDQSTRQDVRHPPFYYLSRMVEIIYRCEPQTVKNLPAPCFNEISKLLIEMQVQGASLSPDVERLRIFKAVSFLLDQLLSQGCQLKPIQDEPVDPVSEQFLSLYHRKVEALFRK